MDVAKESIPYDVINDPKQMVDEIAKAECKPHLQQQICSSIHNVVAMLANSFVSCACRVSCGVSPVAEKEKKQRAALLKKQQEQKDKDGTGAAPMDLDDKGRHDAYVAERDKQERLDSMQTNGNAGSDICLRVAILFAPAQVSRCV